MRMRKKKHSAERIAACSGYLISEPAGSDPRLCFEKKSPLYLEIGCGKGDFALGLANRNPDKNIVAVEKIPDVAMFALEKAAGIKPGPDRGDEAVVPGALYSNIRFIIGDAVYLGDWFPPKSVERIYLNFSDPWPKKGYYKRRLTAPGFLDIYKKILIPGGELHFKTDSEDLFEWSLESFRNFGLELLFSTRDLHSSEIAKDNIMTEYEKRFSEAGMPIYSVHVRFPAELKDAERETNES